jgi:hypothetical protein
MIAKQRADYYKKRKEEIAKFFSLSSNKQDDQSDKAKEIEGGEGGNTSSC